MMRHIWSILCERTSIDRETNLVSYFTAIEAISVRRLPFRIPFLVFASLWRSDSEQGGAVEIRLVMVNPDKSEKYIFPSYKAESSAKRHRTNMILNGLQFSQSGTYSLRLDRRNDEQWELVTEIPLDISVAVQEEEAEKKPEVPESTSKPAHKITDKKVVKRIRRSKKV